MMQAKGLVLTLLIALHVLNLCVQATRAQRCSSTDFRCDNGDCVDESYECDGIDHCGDNSDEYCDYSLYEGNLFSGTCSGTSVIRTLPFHHKCPDYRGFHFKEVRLRAHAHLYYSAR